MYVRIANAEDCEDLFAWRNDEFTRQMSLTVEPIDWNTHCDWFSSALADERRVVLICEEGGTPLKLAVVRFDINKKSASVSINLAPEQRGRRKATGRLKSAIDFLSANHPELNQLVAKIREDNHASVRCFENVGFALLHQNDGVLTYQRRF